MPPAGAAMWHPQIIQRKYHNMNIAHIPNFENDLKWFNLIQYVPKLNYKKDPTPLNIYGKNSCKIFSKCAWVTAVADRQVKQTDRQTDREIVVQRLTLTVLNFWNFTSYCSLKPLWSGMGEVVPARTSPTRHPPSPPTVHQLSWLAL